MDLDSDVDLSLDNIGIRLRDRMKDEGFSLFMIVPARIISYILYLSIQLKLYFWVDNEMVKTYNFSCTFWPMVVRHTWGGKNIPIKSG